jgi:hypothetical protein
VRSLQAVLLVVLAAQLHLEGMLVWLEHWRVLLQRESRKLVTAVSTS